MAGADDQIQALTRAMEQLELNTGNAIRPAVFVPDMDWNLWRQRFTNYIASLTAPTDDKRKQILLGRLGDKALQVLYGIEAELDMTVDEMLDALTTVYGESKGDYLARQKLHQIKQTTGERLEEFMNRVRIATQNAYQGRERAILDETALDYFVSGLQNKRLRERLMCNTYATTQAVIQDAKRIELAIDACGLEKSVMTVSMAATCFYCGGQGHYIADCPKKSTKYSKENINCHFCGKRGHLQRECRQKLEYDGHREIGRGNGRSTRYEGPQRQATTSVGWRENQPPWPRREENGQQMPRRWSTYGQPTARQWSDNSQRQYNEGQNNNWQGNARMDSRFTPHQTAQATRGRNQ
jgi:hypothetical protein